MANPITIRSVRKTYGDFVALEGIDMDIAAGEFMTLLGPSGSGKTTLLMILAGFTRPDAGSIQVAAQEIIRIRRTSGTSAWCSRTTRCFRI